MEDLTKIVRGFQRELERERDRERGREIFCITIIFYAKYCRKKSFKTEDFRKFFFRIKHLLEFTCRPEGP